MKRPDGGNPGFAADLFGVGKNGFKDDPMDPPATQLDAAMFNNIVESLCRLVEDSGQTLDGLDFDQVSAAVQNAVMLDPVVSNGGSLTLEDSSQLVVEGDGGNGGSSIYFAGSMAAAQFDVGAVLQTLIGAVVQLLGSVTIGTTAAQTLTVNSLAELNENVTLAAAKSLILSGTAKVAGGTTSRLEAGTLALQIGAAAPTNSGEVAANSDGNLTWRNDTGGRVAFGSVNGDWVGEDADQVPETALAATTFVTTSSKVDVVGLLRVRVKGEMQRSIAGATTISLERDQGTSTWIAIDNGGVTTKNITTKDTSDANDWTPFQMERTIGVGATENFFRLRVDGNGDTAKIRDTHVTVRRRGA